MMPSLKALAHAKINLYLNILGKGSDRYHNIQSVLQSIVLADELVFTLLRGTQIKTVCNLNSISESENLVWKAAKLLQRELGIEKGAVISIKKTIPVAAGLGGGSADAAATLLGLNKLWNLSLSFFSLQKLAQKLGADVPFCLKGGTLLVQGKGEKLTPLPSLPSTYMLIAKFHFQIQTKAAYEQFDKKKTPPLFHLPKMLKAIKKQNLSEIGANLANILEKVVFRNFPQIEEVKKFALRFGALGALMSGSGPSVFALVQSKPQAQRMAQSLKSLCEKVFITTTYPQGVDLSFLRE